MKKSHLFVLWGGLYSICAGLGFIPEATGAGRFFLTALSLVFFLPPALLLWQASREKDLHTIQLVRNLSALSLLLTALTLIGNFLTALSSEFWGNVLYGMLVILSSPMICCGYWALSLFCWACLLMVSLKLLKKA